MTRMNEGQETDLRLRENRQPESLGTPEPEAVRAPLVVNPSLESVLRAIQSTAPAPWFPSAFATMAGISRDSLDEPLAELRQIGLAQIADWIRGQGQGYVLTPAGEAAVRDLTVLSKLRGGPPDLPPPELETLTGGTQTITQQKPVEEFPISRSIELDLRPPMVTPVLLIANLSWFIVGLLVAWRWNVPFSRYLATGDRELLMRMGAVDGASLLEGDWWRLITCCFVHIGLIHLVVNLFALVMTGPLAEVLWGRLRLTGIYFISGLAGSCLAMTLQPVINGVSTVLAGASGAIWGLMTSLLAWLLLNRDRLPPALVADWSRKLGMVFLLNIGVSFIPGVSWSGHLGGGVAGFLSAGLLNATRNGDPFRRIAAIVLLTLVPVGSIAMLAAAMKTGEAWTSLRAVEARDTAHNRWTKERKKIFDGEVLPNLKAIQIESFLLHEEITTFVIAGSQKVNIPAREAYQVRIDQLRTLAKGAVMFFKERDTGNHRFDREFAKASALAQAELTFLDHLRQILDSREVPSAEEWKRLRAQRDLVVRYAEPFRGRIPVPLAPPPAAPPAAPAVPLT